VTGTVFDVRWSGGDEVIEVRMRSGSVQVGGPLLPERVTLRAGQRLTAKLASGEMVIGDARIGDARAGNDDGTAPRARLRRLPRRRPAAPIPPLAPSAPTAALAPPAPAPERAPAAAPPARPSAAAHRAAASHAAAANAAPWAPRAWSSAITSGNAARVVAEAEGHGIEKTLLEVDGGALMALSDASRYSGRPEMAVRALMAERQRFPDTPFAHAAAFLLGKLADDHGEVTTGLAWYRRYLAETPDGPYAAEALGRKMLAVERLSGRDAARGIAAEYVERFPNGTYMLQAHAILANPSTP